MSPTTFAPHGLTIISYNTDNFVKEKLAEILSFAEEVGADVVLLQDIDKQRWSKAYLLKQGWTLYTHKRVGIMLRISTAEKVISCKDSAGAPHARVWRSQKYDSMGIVLDTTRLGLAVYNLRLPPTGYRQVPR